MFGGACMSEKLDFYEVNVDYVKYLKQFDSRIPNVEYQNRNKFLCGTLFKINGLNYFAPVSSFNIKQSSNYVIEVGNVPVGSVRYSFMFPVPDLEMLEQMYEKHEKEREIYLKEHPIVKQKMDVEYEEIEEDLDEMDMEI